MQKIHTHEHHSYYLKLTYLLTVVKSQQMPVCTPPGVQPEWRGRFWRTFLSPGMRLKRLYEAIIQ